MQVSPETTGLQPFTTEANTVAGFDNHGAFTRIQYRKKVTTCMITVIVYFGVIHLGTQ